MNDYLGRPWVPTLVNRDIKLGQGMFERTSPTVDWPTPAEQQAARDAGHPYHYGTWSPAFTTEPKEAE